MADDSRTAGQRILQATWSMAVAGTATSRITLPEASAGFHANADGTAVVRLANASSDSQFNVQNGGYYPYSIVSVAASNAVSLVAVFNSVPE